MATTKVWPRKKLSAVCESIVDCVNKTAPTVEDVTPFRMIRTTNVKNGRIDLSSVKYVTRETFEHWTRRQTLKTGDVILTREAPLGEVGLVRESDGLFLGQRLVCYRANPRVLDGRFLLYSMQAGDMQSQIKALGSGSTVEHMRVPDAENLEIALPDLPIQQRIGTILSAYDDLLENNLKRIKALEEMARLIYGEWFVRFRFPGRKNVKYIRSELGEIPPGWVVKSVKDVAEVIYGYPFDSSKFNVIGNGTPLVRIRDIPKEYSETFTEQTCDRKFHIKDGEILVGMDGDFHMCIWSGGHAYQNQRVARFVPHKNMGQLFLFFALETPIQSLNKAIIGTTVAHLGDAHIKTIKILCPSDDVLAKANSILEPIAREIMNLRCRSRNLRITRDLLLPPLISGKITFGQMEKPAES